MKELKKVKRIPGGYEERFELNGKVYAMYTEDSKSNYKLKHNFCRVSDSLDVLVAMLTRCSLRLFSGKGFD